MPTELPGPFRHLKLDRRCPDPAYVQIARALSELLTDSGLPPGYPLPPERALCHQFGVSRMTLRQAIALLEREGMLLSQRGRGTFVAHDLLRKQQQEMRSFSEEVIARGGVPKSRMLSFNKIAAPDEAKAFFALSDEDGIYEIRRTRLSDDVPLAFETVWLSERLCPNLERFDLEKNSLYRILEDTYGIRLETCVEEVSAELPAAEERELLELPRNVAVLVVKRKTYTDVGWALELCRSAYRGDRYSAVVHSVRKKRLGEK